MAIPAGWSEASGLRPGTRQEALPPGPPPRAAALGTINLVGALRRACPDLPRFPLALLREPANGQIAKGLALCWRSRRQSLLVGCGVKPRLFRATALTGTREWVSIA